MLKLQQHLLVLLAGLTLSSNDDDLSSEISVSEEEASSLLSSYSSFESSSGPRGGRRAYRQGYEDAMRQQDYRGIPPRRRRY